MKFHSKKKQKGLSMGGFIIVLALLAMVGLVALQVVPSVTEYFSIKKAVMAAQESETSARDIQVAFDKKASAGYITSISGKDLQITRNDGGYDVAFAYEKRIPLFGPVSLVIDYESTTKPSRLNKVMQ